MLFIEQKAQLKLLHKLNVRIASDTSRNFSMNEKISQMSRAQRGKHFFFSLSKERFSVHRNQNRVGFDECA